MKKLDQAVQRAGELGSHPGRGLTNEQVQEKRRRHGENRMPVPPRRSVWRMFLDALGDRTLIVLMGAAALSAGVEWLHGRLNPAHTPRFIDGIAILCAVLIASLMTTLNEARAAREFRALSSMRADYPVQVLREGRVREVSVYEVVVGDVVQFGTGDRLPADGLLLSGVDVRVDESMLTGESEPASKEESDPVLRSGTTVTTGNGSMLVEKVGPATEAGRLQISLTSEEEEPTPLQERLGKLADRIGVFGVAAAGLTFLALAVSALARGEIPLELSLDTGGAMLEYLIVAVTIIVVAVPEGLPLAVTISLAYSVRKMAGDKNLVRRLASPETMGAATVVCTDKTGTLTENRMTVVDAEAGGGETGRAPGRDDFARDEAEIFADIAAIDSTAHLQEEDGTQRYLGDATEGALLMLVASWGVDWSRRREEADVVRQYGFSSARKRMSTLVRTGRGLRLLVKGAPEVILERSVRRHRQQGIEELDDQGLRELEDQVEEFASRGQRTLALAYRNLGEEAPEQDADQVERELTLLCLVAIADPLRPAVADAVAACRRAGVEVKLVTGDNRITARSIARQVGLLDEDDQVVDHRELEDGTIEELAPRLRVLSRARPEDKHRLVEILQQRGEVVAVTGDGTNDAPALRKADVGLAMGRRGTEVAKEASDIVLLDDNFATIVNGIRWGRGIFDNIRKFLQFQLTVNLVAVSTAFLAAVSGFGVPLNTVQLLWVNLIMDTLAALALATEPPRDELLEQPPHGRHAPLITPMMGSNILVIGAVMLGLLLVTMWTDWLVPAATPHAEKATFVFNAFVMMQLFNEINARSTRHDRGVLRGVLQSKLFVGVLVVTAVCQVLIVQYGGRIFRTTPLGPDLWLRSVLLGASMLLAGAALRFAGRRLHRTRAAKAG